MIYASAGRKTVTATASTTDKLDSLLAIPNGATHVANYKTQDFSAEVKKVTDGKGVNVLIDFVGQSHWNKNIDSLALEGRMTMLALLSGESVRSTSMISYCPNHYVAGSQVPSANIAPILFKRLRIQGSTLRSRTLEYQTNLVQRSVA